jgi:hypothetical protein
MMPIVAGVIKLMTQRHQIDDTGTGFLLYILLRLLTVVHRTDVIFALEISAMDA